MKKKKQKRKLHEETSSKAAIEWLRENEDLLTNKYMYGPGSIKTVITYLSPKGYGLSIEKAKEKAEERLSEITALDYDPERDRPYIEHTHEVLQILDIVEENISEMKNESTQKRKKIARWVKEEVRRQLKRKNLKEEVYRPEDYKELSRFIDNLPGPSYRIVDRMIGDSEYAKAAKFLKKQYADRLDLWTNKELIEFFEQDAEPRHPGYEFESKNNRKRAIKKEENEDDLDPVGRTEKGKYVKVGKVRDIDNDGDVDDSDVYLANRRKEISKSAKKGSNLDEQSMRTFGVVPDIEEIEQRLGSGGFPMTLKGADELAADYAVAVSDRLASYPPEDAEEFRDLVLALVETPNPEELSEEQRDAVEDILERWDERYSDMRIEDEAASLASGMMSVIGVEWV